MTSLSTQDLNDLLQGACILGAGGGGPISMGQAGLTYIGTRSVPLIGLDEAANDGLVLVCAGAGAPEAEKHFPVATLFRTIDLAEELLLAAHGKRFSYVLPIETGAGSTLLAAAAAVYKNVPLIDADPAGRAVPELTMLTLASLPPSPVVLADDKGAQLSFSVPTTAAAEPPMRAAISSAPFTEFAGLSLWPLPVSTMRPVLIPNTVSFTRDLGRSLREARAAGRDPIETVVSALGGRVLARDATLTAQTDSTSGGFDLGQLTITCTDGSQILIYNKNENFLAWSSAASAPLITAPGLISYLTMDGAPFSNADTPPIGTRIAVIASPARPQLLPLLPAFVSTLQSIGYGGAPVLMPSPFSTPVGAPGDPSR